MDWPRWLEVEPAFLETIKDRLVPAGGQAAFLTQLSSLLPASQDQIEGCRSAPETRALLQRLSGEVNAAAAAWALPWGTDLLA